MEELLNKIERDIRKYLTMKERKLREELKGSIRIDETFNGYRIKIEGHILRAFHDSSTHRWIFSLMGDVPGDYTTFFETSEKKGETVISFFKALTEAIISSQDTVVQNDKSFALDHNDNSFGEAERDLAAEDDENFGDEENEEAIII